MLSYLRIENFGVFHDVGVELLPGLSAFTGETGAGKSMVVDALMACLGHRTPKDFIRTGESKARVELLVRRPDPFPWDAGSEPEILFQREIHPERSFLKINGKMATAGMAQEISGHLVDIHGQQEHHSLMRPQNHLAILDSLDRARISPLKQAYQEDYVERESILGEIWDLGTDAVKRQREIDLLSYQVKEIREAEFREGEEEDLRSEYRVLTSQKRLMDLAGEAYNLLYSGVGDSIPASEGLSVALSLLEKASAIDPTAALVAEAVGQVSFALEAALDLLRAYRQKLNLHPGRLAAISDRLDLLHRLKAKYGETVGIILEYKRETEKRLHDLIHSEETLADLKEGLSQTESRMAKAAQGLTALRRGVATRMEEEVTCSLGDLGMPGARFVAAFEVQRDSSGIPACERTGHRVKAFPHGVDKVSFLFSANPGEPPMPVNKVASGGELSRLMLAVKAHLGERDPVPTLIFDEIDAGIGGKAGQAVAVKLLGVSKRHQVLCVTHLASIAAMADNHYLVSKTEKDGRTFASVKLLSGEERVAEIARMLSGTDLTISHQHAKELLRAALRFKSA